MNVKLKKRMTKLFKDLEPGDMFQYDRGAVCMRIESVDTVNGHSYNAVDLNCGDLHWFYGHTEVEIIHGTFVEEGAE